MNKIALYSGLLMMSLALACNNGKDTETDDTDPEDTEVIDTVVEDTEVEPPAPDCATYCTSIQASCTTEQGGYPDEATCLSVCGAAGWDVGTSADTSGNTLGCRTYHAGAAATDAVTHCPHASLFGGGVCGDVISNYCDSIAHVCTGDNAPTWTADCATDAAAYAAGTPGDTSGDTLECRLYHLGVAHVDADTHCGHAGPTGDGVCIDPI
jgi:hypothetical protein